MKGYMNPHVAQKLFDEIQIAEFRYQNFQIPHAVTFHNRSHGTNGALLKEMKKIAALGDEATKFVHVFLEDFDEYRKGMEDYQCPTAQS